MKRWMKFILFNMFFLLGTLSLVFAQQIGDTGIKADTIFWEAVSKIGGDNQSAIELLEESSQMYLKHKNYKRYTLCFQGIATIYQLEGQVEKEKEYWEKAYYDLVPYADIITEYIGIAAHNLAAFEIGYGHYTKALTLLDSAQNYLLGLSSYEDSIGVLRIINQTYNNLGVVYSKLGNHQKALQMLEVTLEHANILFDPDDINRLLLLNNLGTQNYFIGNYERAKFYYHKTLKLAKKENLGTIPIYNAHQNLALVHLKENRLDSVKILLSKIDKLPKKDTLKVYRPGVIHQIQGEYFLKVDSLEKALFEFKNQLSWRTREFELGYDKRVRFFIQAHQQLAETYQDLGHLDSALQIYQEALTRLDISIYSAFTPYPLLGAPILDGKAQVHLNRYNLLQNSTELDTILWCYLVADSLIDRARNNIQNEDSKLFLSKKSRPIYERAIRFCFMMYDMTGDQQYLEKGYYFSERNKATLLLQSLQDTEAKLVASLPDSLLEQEQNLKVDIFFYKNKIFELQQSQTKKDSSQLSNFQQALFDKEESYRILISKLETEYPAYYGLKYDQSIKSVNEIQESLSPGEFLVAFFEGDSSIYVFSIAKENVGFYELERTAAYDQQFQLLLSSLHQPQQGLSGLKSFAEPAYDLYQQLLEPVLSKKKYDQLVIIPDGQLAYLPFELLLDKPISFEGLDDRQAGRYFRQLPYLLTKKTIRYGYSGSLLFSNLYEPQAVKHEMAAFGPAYKGRWFLSTNQAQAESVAEILGGDAFTGPQANKQNFMAMAPDYRILHLAMHAEPDLYSPLRARLIFAGEDSAQTTSLYAYELYNLNLNAQLAVLAACESGHGKLEKSEGIYSLARAFRYAGCPAIVSSFWKADGDATTSLMHSFYTHLGQGDHKAEALQASKLDYLETASNSRIHPYYWGNFVVIGDDAPIDEDKTWLWFFAVLVLVIGAVGYKIYSSR